MLAAAGAACTGCTPPADQNRMFTAPKHGATTPRQAYTNPNENPKMHDGGIHRRAMVKGAWWQNPSEGGRWLWRVAHAQCTHIHNTITTESTQPTPTPTGYQQHGHSHQHQHTKTVLSNSTTNHYMPTSPSRNLQPLLTTTSTTNCDNHRAGIDHFTGE